MCTQRGELVHKLTKTSFNARTAVEAENKIAIKTTDRDAIIEIYFPNKPPDIFLNYFII